MEDGFKLGEVAQWLLSQCNCSPTCCSLLFASNVRVQNLPHLIMDLLAVFVNMAYCLMFLLACSQAAFFF